MGAGGRVPGDDDATHVPRLAPSLDLPLTGGGDLQVTLSRVSPMTVRSSGQAGTAALAWSTSALNASGS